jgi:hypothetical protein
MVSIVLYVRRLSVCFQCERFSIIAVSINMAAPNLPWLGQPPLQSGMPQLYSVYEVGSHLSFLAYWGCQLGAYPTLGVLPVWLHCSGLGGHPNDYLPKSVCCVCWHMLFSVASDCAAKILWFNTFNMLGVLVSCAEVTSATVSWRCE